MFESLMVIPMIFSVIVISAVVIGVFLLIWPVLVWLHLRKQTDYLREIRDLLKNPPKPPSDTII